MYMVNKDGTYNVADLENVFVGRDIRAQIDNLEQQLQAATHLHKPILTTCEAAELLAISEKRFRNIISEEKKRLNKNPDFVCNASGRISMRINTSKLLEWVNSEQKRRGRPPKQ